MDNEQKQRNTAGICFIGLVLLVCAWLIPSSVVLASRASDEVNVSVSVGDSAGVEVGQAAMTRDVHLLKDQVITQFVTRTASSWLMNHFANTRSGGFGALMNVAVPPERGTGGASFDGVVPSGVRLGSGPSDAMIITVSML